MHQSRRRSSAARRKQRSTKATRKGAAENNPAAREDASNVIHVQASSTARGPGASSIRAIDGPLTSEAIATLWQSDDENTDEFGIDVHNMGVTSIRSFGRGQCRRVRSLDVSFNKLRLLEKLEELPALQVLKAHGNMIEDIREYDFPRSSVLETVYLSGNRLATVPKVLGNLRKLAELRLDCNGIRGMPTYDHLYSCRKLKYLNLSRNHITGVKGLESIGTLETLILAANELQKLHPALRRLDNLQELDLSGNRLQSIAELAGIEKLTVLRLANNRIGSWKTIPPIPTLTELHLQGNRLTSGPSNPEAFPELDVLDIGDNRIDDYKLLSRVVKLTGLISLRVEGNPICIEDVAASRKICLSMPGLAVMNGQDTTLYGGSGASFEVPDLTSAAAAAAAAPEKDASSKSAASEAVSSAASSGSKKDSAPPGSSFTLSIASILADDEPRSKSVPSRPSGSSLALDLSQMRRPPSPRRIVYSGTDVGKAYGLKRPMSARSSPGRGESSRPTSSRPVLRMPSQRTGRGHRLKRIEDIDDAARAYREVLSKTRDQLGVDPRRKSESGSAVESPRPGEPAPCEGEVGLDSSEAPVPAAGAESAAETKRAPAQAVPRRRAALRDALEFSRQNVDSKTAEGGASSEGGDSDAYVAPQSPAGSENSGSTVTQPSPDDIRHLDKDFVERCEDVDGNAADHDVGAAPKSARSSATPRLGRERRKQKKGGGFRKFRVPARAKAYVHRHLDHREHSTSDSQRK